MSDWGDDPIQSMAVMNRADFHAHLDKLFGKGKWVDSSGYRTPGQEDALRAEGAGTVPAGRLSSHSLGTEEAPGAYDISVPGLSPAQVATKLENSGLGFHKILPEGAHGKEGAHLHVEPYLTDDWGNDTLVHPKPEPAPKPKPTPLQKARESTLDQIVSREKENIKDVGRATAKRYGEAAEQYRKDLSSPLIDFSSPKNFLKSALETASLSRPVHMLADAASAVAAPVQGFIDATFGKGVEQATKGRVSRETAGDVASLAIPVAGELNTAREAAVLAKETGLGANAARNLLAKQKAAAALPGPARPNVLKQVEPDSRAAKVQRLEDDGIYVTPWAKRGGTVKTRADKMTSNPHVGDAIIAENNHSIDTFNRALYNKALKPIGEFYGKNMPVGRDGVAYVKAKMDKAYDAILPHVKVEADAQARQDIAELRERAKTLGPHYEAQFNAILEQEILRPIREGGGVMDGRRFKDTESQLGIDAGAYKGNAQDRTQQKLGYLLDDTNNALREAAERSSPLGIRARLRKVNEGYAAFARIRDASTRRTTTGEDVEFGTITPGDLMNAVKRGDKSVGKGRFATGDALLQRFAEDAASVIPSKYQDSGTAGRSAMGRIGTAFGAGMGGLHGAALGYAADVASQGTTNALARHLLARNREPRMGNPRNYLKSTQQRVLAPAAATHLLAPPTDQQ